MLTFARLGFWQLGRAHRPNVSSATGVAVPLDRVSQLGQSLPDSASGELVTATGAYDLAHQFLVVDRSEAGTCWVLTPLRLSDGSGLVVIRGSIPAGSPTPVAPTGSVVVTGALEPSENPTGRQPALAGALASVTTENLVTLLPYSIRDGFAILTEQFPTSSLQPVPVPRVVRASGLRWQNTLYAVQWWIFAAFAVFFVAKVVRDDVRRRADIPIDPQARKSG